MSSLDSIADIRNTYKLKTLLEGDVVGDPIAQFKVWWDEAVHSNIDEVNAMTIATATPAGYPSARMVLLKGIHDDGFVFYTNYHGRKASEIKLNPHVALVFFWKELERQVRVEGIIGRVSREESEVYFHSRPRESQIGAWTSHQSAVIPSREFLEKEKEELENKYRDQEIPLPPFWGGYIVHPQRVEFWQGRPGRLHDRILYTLVGSDWKIERLAP